MSSDKPQISLSSLLVPSKTTEVEMPGFPGFKVKVQFLSKDAIIKLRKKATTQKFKNRQVVEETDDKLFLELYTKEVIKGWSGLTIQYLEQLAPVDAEGLDPATELPYSPDEAVFLMNNSSAFDTWISDIVTDLGNFQSPSKKA